jgi:DNA-binding NarL/FixJ family response regulator
MNPINIIAGDPDYLVREGIAAIISNTPGFELIASLSNLDDLLEAVLINQPNVLVVNYHQYKDGVEILRKIRKIAPHTGILVIADPQDRADIRKALDYGANAYLLKECDKEEICEAILETAKMGSFLCGRILTQLNIMDSEESLPEPNSCAGMNITVRELEIIRLVAEGMSNKEIADKLFLSTHTVTTHRKNIMNKLQVNNTAGLVLYAVRNNILAQNKFLFS